LVLQADRVIDFEQALGQEGLGGGGVFLLDLARRLQGGQHVGGGLLRLQGQLAFFLFEVILGVNRRDRGQKGHDRQGQKTCVRCRHGGPPGWLVGGTSSSPSSCRVQAAQLFRQRKSRKRSRKAGIGWKTPPR